MQRHLLRPVPLGHACEDGAHPDLKVFYDGSKINLYDLKSYIGALIEDDRVEAVKCHRIPRA